MLSGRGPESHDRAEHLRSEMEKLMSECGDCKGEACNEFAMRLKLSRSMLAGDTFSQMSKCRKFGFGKNQGFGGMGSGGMMAMGTTQPGQSQTLLGGESMLGRREGGQSVNTSDGLAQIKPPAGSETAAEAAGARTGINAETAVSSSLSGEAALDDYRTVVDAYFRRLTLNKEQKP
jgi:hypothetical protein